mmetsp:Transcript_87721/g.281642  ORF Transcript_87721/g.281642 Transcript_87721/m.281642 type:complete len:349 (+) Transcript_87721:40-1086(+)
MRSGSKCLEHISLSKSTARCQCSSRAKSSAPLLLLLLLPPPPSQPLATSPRAACRRGPPSSALIEQLKLTTSGCQSAAQPSSNWLPRSQPPAGGRRHAEGPDASKLKACRQRRPFSQAATMALNAVTSGLRPSSTKLPKALIASCHCRPLAKTEITAVRVDAVNSARATRISSNKATTTGQRCPTPKLRAMAVYTAAVGPFSPIRAAAANASAAPCAPAESEAAQVPRAVAQVTASGATRANSIAATRPMAAGQAPAPSAAAKVALKVTKSGSTLANCISGSNCSAVGHCTAAAHALTTALNNAVSGIMEACGNRRSNCNASLHKPRLRKTPTAAVSSVPRARASWPA